MKVPRLYLKLLWLHTGSAHAAPVEGTDVTGLLHTLHGVQDEIARGDLSALSLQTELAERLKETLENPLSKAKNEVEWATVAIGYALDGAKPQVARRLLGRVDASNPMHALAQAVSEYTTGNMKNAARLFDEVDFVRIDPRIAPYVALAMGTANLGSDDAKTIRNFEHAALLGPGTLVEEVALRRLAMLGVSGSDVGLFQRATNLYIRRYHSSPFAGQFFALLAEKAPLLLDEPKTRDLAGLVAAHLPNAHIPILLSLAETIAVAGKLETVRFLVDSYLIKKQGTAGVASQKIKLYDVVSRKASTYDQATLEMIAAIDPAALTAKEKVLLSKAKATLESILQPLTAIENDKSQTAKELYQPQEPTTAVDGTSETSPAPEAGVQPAVTENAAGKQGGNLSSPAQAEAVATPEITPTQTPVQAEGNAEKIPSGSASVPTAPKETPKEPVIDEIDILSPKTQKVLQAVDDLLKEPKP